MRRLPKAASVLLDVLRFSAALLVVLAHVGHREIATGFRDLQVLGQLAVPVFFVLSGFVIRFVTRSRAQDLRGFLIDRGARMYSVMLPAMLLTVVLSASSYALAPQYYLHHFGAFSNHPLTRVFFNLVFLSQSWGHTIIPLIDLPFWSLSYECLYYVAYGLFFFLRGRRRVMALVVWAGLAGPQVIFLLPVWWLGCWIYDLYSALRTTQLAMVMRLFTLVTVLPATLLVVFDSRLRGVLWAGSRAFGRLPEPLGVLHLAPERATLSAFAIGVLAGVALLLLLLLSDLMRMKTEGAWAHRFRHVADGTFAIYLMHYPLLVFATAAGLLRPGRPVVSWIVIGVICAGLILAARPLDALKRAMRSRFERGIALPGVHRRWRGTAPVRAA